MLIPLFGLLLSVLLFSVIAAVVLSLSRWTSLRLSTFLAFVASAHLGFIAYGYLYARAFASPAGELTDSSAVVIFLAGIPVVGAISGWLGARLLTRVRSRSGPA